MWVNDGCVFLSLHTRLVETNERLDRFEEILKNVLDQDKKR